MVVKLEQLASQLSSQMSAVLLSGDEPLLMMEAQDLVRQKARDLGFSERHIHDVNRQFDFSQLGAGADNLSLFAEKKLIELRFEKLPDKNQQAALLELLAQPLDDHFWLISCPKMDKRQLGNKWVKALDNQGIVVQIWPVPVYQLPQWLSARARQLGISIEPDALQLLADRSEGNLLAASQDMNKLALLASDKAIGLQEVMDAVANNARYTTFELIDTALAGQSEKVARMIQQLRQEGVVPVVLVATLYREVRQLYKMSQEVASGSTIADVLKSHRVWSNRTRLLSGALQKLPAKVWLKLVTRCAHLDKMAKGLEGGNVWDELLTCLLLLGGKLVWKKVV